jgi:hypothetical protein
VSLFDGELVVDNFAGGGGASTGIEAAWGQDPDSALRTEATIDSLLARALLIRGRA